MYIFAQSGHKFLDMLMLMMNLFMWSEDSRVVKLMAAYVIACQSTMPQTSGNDLSITDHGLRAIQWHGG